MLLRLPGFLLAALAGCAASRPDPTGTSRQLVLVTTADWNAVAGVMALFDRETPEHPWRLVRGQIQVVVGRSGLGVGRGLHDATASKGPRKREGDGRAPAGVFRLGPGFGTVPHAELRGIRMPYLRVTANHLCIDDPESRYYNQLVDRSAVASPAWSSAEDLLRKDQLYELGVVVHHNVAPVEPGAGSCIFLHVWSGSGQGTAGCTAMAREDLASLLLWLRPGAVLAQAPAGEHFIRLP